MNFEETLCILFRQVETGWFTVGSVGVPPSPAPLDHTPKSWCDWNLSDEGCQVAHGPPGFWDVPTEPWLSGKCAAWQGELCHEYVLGHPNANGLFSKCFTKSCYFFWYTILDKPQKGERDVACMGSFDARFRNQWEFIDGFSLYSAAMLRPRWFDHRGKWVTFTRTHSVRWLPWDVRPCGFHIPGSLWDVASSQTHQKSGGIETSWGCLCSWLFRSWGDPGFEKRPRELNGFNLGKYGFSMTNQQSSGKDNTDVLGQKGPLAKCIESWVQGLLQPWHKKHMRCHS